MAVITRHIECSTHGNAEIVNITPDISDELGTSGFINGIVIV